MRTRFFCYESLDIMRDAENARSHRRARNLGLSLLALNLALLPWGIEAAKFFWQTY